MAKYPNLRHFNGQWTPIERGLVGGLLNKDKILKLRYFSYKNILEMEMIDWDEKMSDIIQSLKEIYDVQTTNFLSNHFVWS